MADNKKFYWLKLKEDFFDDKTIKYLRKLPDGNSLVIIYLKMQLKSLKTEGFLKYDKLFPTYEEELALMLDEDITMVRFAITALIKIGVVERWENDMLYMASMQQLIGSETAVAERVRRHREMKKQSEEALQCNAGKLLCNTVVTNCNTEIEIEKELDKERELKNARAQKEKNVKTQKHKYGEYKNILLTDDELNKLEKEFPSKYKQIIEKLSEYVESVGKHYKSHYATIRKWIREDKNNQNDKKATESEASYSIEEYENDWKNHNEDMIKAFINKGKTVSNAV